MEAWLSELERGSADAAWDLFLERFRRLIFAAIRHYVRDYDDVMDVFTRVCEALRADDLRRLREYGAGGERQARFSTWLVVVVHHLTVDWLRARDGRARPGAAAGRLPPLQRAIYEHTVLDGLSPGEAYELIRARDRPGLRFGEFLRELRATRRAVGDERSSVPGLGPAHPPQASGPFDPAADAERRGVVAAALGALPPEDRAAVQLYVLDGLPAAAVARVLGERNAKAVYNRVYRALAAMRERLESAGIRRDSLL